MDPRFKKNPINENMLVGPAGPGNDSPKFLGSQSMRPILLAAVSLLFVCGVATAATPVLSGKYVTNYNEICQANGQSGNDGASYAQAVIADFDSAKGTVKITGTSIEGPLTNAKCCSTNYTSSPVSESGSYSNTATAITIGQSTYSIVYGPVKNGIAQSATFVGISNGGCSASAMAVRQ